MIVFVKKQHLNFLCFGIALFVLICVMCSLNPKNTSVSVPGGFAKTIVLDAGHGEPDGGAVGKSGTFEEELNLEVTLELQKLLEKSGIKVILTRHDSNGIFSEGLSTIRKKKVSDMKNREEIMNSSNADAFISIHMNKFTDSKYSGPQVFYSSQFDEAKILAENIQKELINELNPKMEREIKKSDKNIYLLQNAQIPAVLVECGFLSNYEEEKLLLSDEYRKNVAWAIYKGIITYFANE